jgi:hypothetical protein
MPGDEIVPDRSFNGAERLPKPVNHIVREGLRPGEVDRLEGECRGQPRGRRRRVPR